MDYNALPHFVPSPFNDAHEMKVAAKLNDLEFATRTLVVTAFLIALVFVLFALFGILCLPFGVGGITLA
jgi:cytochrome c oxidase assembly protein Cox11